MYFKPEQAFNIFLTPIRVESGKQAILALKIASASVNMLFILALR